MTILTQAAMIMAPMATGLAAATTIDEKTALPLGVAVGAMGVVVWVVWRAAKLDSTLKLHTKALEEGTATFQRLDKMISKLPCQSGKPKCQMHRVNTEDKD